MARRYRRVHDITESCPLTVIARATRDLHSKTLACVVEALVKAKQNKTQRHIYIFHRGGFLNSSGALMDGLWGKASRGFSGGGGGPDSRARGTGVSYLCRGLRWNVMWDGAPETL